MKSRTAMVSILVLLLALLLAFTSVTWAQDVPACTDFRIEGTTKQVIPWSFATDPYGSNVVDVKIKAEGDVIWGGSDWGTFTFTEWVEGTLYDPPFDIHNSGVVKIKPKGSGGKIFIEFAGGPSPSGGVFGLWEIDRATGRHRNVVGEGHFVGTADHYDPETGEWSGFYVDFICGPPPPTPPPEG